MDSRQKFADLSVMQDRDIPARALTLARFSLLDWMACGLAGIEEPLAVKLRQMARSEAGTPQADLFGGLKAPARMAALVNGATGHALDYDDTHFGHIGHLSVGIYPAALAAAQQQECSAEDVVRAFVVGAEFAIRLGMTLGAQHYNHGYHQTATAGAFGATVAAGRIYGLNETQMRHAVHLCATRASGLKSQFGTMGKPYNAGISAANGVECAQLAALDFTAAEDGLLGPQGFVETHSQDIDHDSPWAESPADKFLFEDNKYKLHACCHGLHAMIEVLLADESPQVALDDIALVEIETNPRWLRVCDKKRPGTGLEVKFSYAWLAGMTLRGDNTADDRTYSDQMAQDPQIAAFADRVKVVGDAGLSDTQVRGTLEMRDGTKQPFAHDLQDPLPPEVLEQKLRAKARALLPDAGDRIWGLLDTLSEMRANDLGSQIARAG